MKRRGRFLKKSPREANQDQIETEYLINKYKPKRVPDHREQLEKVKRSKRKTDVDEEAEDKGNKDLFYTSGSNHGMASLLNNTSTHTQMPSALLSSNVKSKIGLKHHPQVMDRDTENFKNRLENMLNKFKVETVSEFMEAKRCLLEEQATVLGGQKTQFEIKLRSLEAEVLSFWSNKYDS